MLAHRAFVADVFSERDYGGCFVIYGNALCDLDRYLPGESTGGKAIASADKSPNNGTPEAAVDVDGITWQDAAERMERLRKQGVAFTSQRRLAGDFGCSSATINKAIKATPSLQMWAKQPIAAPRSQSINDVVIDRTSQCTETNPEDDAAIREFIENADPETRGWFQALSEDDQLFHLDEPNKLDEKGRILGRKA